MPKKSRRTTSDAVTSHTASLPKQTTESEPDRVRGTALPEQFVGFRRINRIIQAASHRRLNVRAAASGTQFYVLINDHGQILLEPVVPVSERDVWLAKNPEAMASVV